MPAVAQLNSTVRCKPGRPNSFNLDMERIGSIDITELLGPYDQPSDVSEWKWIEACASFAHCNNGVYGVHEFILNLSCEHDEVPKRLQPAIDEAKARGLAYLIIHQGT